jgi:maltooligosyltrehalose trehalohydrolase
LFWWARFPLGYALRLKVTQQSEMATVTSSEMEERPLGATRLPSGEWQFVLWAPHWKQVSVHVSGTNQRIIDMEPGERGYHTAVVDGIVAGTQYVFRLEGSRELPDPASRFQPEGVHGPSQLVDTRAFEWTDQGWEGIELEDSIFYELHVGTYTPKGTFEALIAHLDELRSLGVTTVEVMPIAQFPGERNWGYDGAYPFAPQNTYGGPEGLQKLVSAAHARGLAVALDVVYNHLGPEGNYLGEYGPYFTDRYRTPWGQAINYDGAGSDEVRRFFRENALNWLEQYHFDALRLDAIHGIFDFSARHFLAELKGSVSELSRRLGRQLYLIAESDLNDARVIAPRQRGGYEIDAQWSDDFHHSVHTLLTKENNGYYQDFGAVRHLAETLKNGWCYRGQYSQYRQRRHGNSAEGISSSHFVVCNQNHDQVGNRAAGERLSALVGFEALKLAAGITLLSPYVPLLFMGEEYGETAPFQYFISHLDPVLVEAVRHGRRAEFAAFGWQDRVPDPQDEETFRRSMLQHPLKEKEPHAALLRFYKELISLRKKCGLGSQRKWHAWENKQDTLVLFREDRARYLAMVLNFGDDETTPELPQWQGLWRTRIWSADRIWNGPADPLPEKVRFSKPFVLKLHPHSFAVFESQLSELEPV